MRLKTAPTSALLPLFALLASLGGLAPPAGAQPAGPIYFPSDSPRAPFSEAVQAGDFLFASGQIGFPPKERPDDFDAAARSAMDAIAKVLAAHGSDLDHVVACTVMLADMKQWPAFNAVYVTYFKAGRLPARSAFGANGLANGAPLEVSCFAYAPRQKP